MRKVRYRKTPMKLCSIQAIRQFVSDVCMEYDESLTMRLALFQYILRILKGANYNGIK